MLITQTLCDNFASYLIPENVLITNSKQLCPKHTDHCVTEPS